MEPLSNRGAIAGSGAGAPEARERGRFFKKGAAKRRFSRGLAAAALDRVRKGLTTAALLAPGRDFTRKSLKSS